MFISKTKSLVSIVALFLTFTLTASVFTPASGLTLPVYETMAFLSFRPNPIGINQELLVNAWVAPAPVWSTWVYTGYMFYITDPTGDVTTIGPLTSEQPGTVFFMWYPDKLGNWTIQFSFPGNFYSAPCSVTRSFTVQQDPVPSWQDTPLPTDGWNYPINIENRLWYQIAGPWFQSDYNASKLDWNQYTQGVRSSHILWRIPPVVGIGGLEGGDYGTTGYYTKSSASINVVMGGRGYYQAGGVIYCVDIRTGKLLWSTPGGYNVGALRGSSAGQGTVAPGESSTLGFAGTPVLYQLSSVGAFRAYDGLTGAKILDVPGPSNGGYFAYVDPFVYTMWNYTEGKLGARLIKWTTVGNSANFTSRVVWNVTYPDYDFNFGWNGAIWGNTLALCMNLRNESDPDFYTGGFQFAKYPSVHIPSIRYFNLTTGATRVVNTTGWQYHEGPMVGASYGKFYYPYDEPLTWTAYDLKTGAHLWNSDPARYPWGNFWAYSCTAGYDKLYALGYDGVYAFNINTGKQEWVFHDRPALMETPYGTWPFGSGGAVLGGGVLYAPNSEHSPTLPYLRGWMLHALDAFNGKEIWNIRGYWSTNAVAEGTLFATNDEDGYSYAFARGPTLTNIAVSKDDIASGESVWIKGRVTDQSAAQPGTPAVSRDSMTAWMQYLYRQDPMPTNTTGVPVHLYACHSNGTAYEIATVNSDGQGYFKYKWTPPNEDYYYVSANFMGDESYYSSWNTTTLTVGAAPQAAPQYPQPIAPIDYTPMFAGIIAAVAVVAVIVVVSLFWKRK